MDEATIDCTFCGGHGAVEIRMERLSEAAEWQRAGHWVICARHLHQVRTSLWEGLAADERLVVQHC